MLFILVLLKIMFCMEKEKRKDPIIILEESMNMETKNMEFLSMLVISMKEGSTKMSL